MAIHTTFTIFTKSNSHSHSEPAGNNLRAAKKALKDALQGLQANGHSSRAYLQITATEENLAGYACDGKGRFCRVAV